LGDLGIDGRTILKWILKETGWKDVEWISVAQDNEVAGCCECDLYWGLVEGEHLGDLGIDGRTILKWILTH